MATSFQTPGVSFFCFARAFLVSLRFHFGEWMLTVIQTIILLSTFHYHLHLLMSTEKIEIANFPYNMMI